MTHDQVVRDFAAAFLRSEVAKDGQVKGFGAWYDDASPWHREQFYRLAGLAAREIESGGSPEDAIAGRVRRLRDRFRSYVEPERVRVPVSEVAELLARLGESFGWDTGKDESTPVVPTNLEAEYLRRNGIRACLWPPNFMSKCQLERIGWPWPEWPKTHSYLLELHERSIRRRPAKDAAIKSYSDDRPMPWPHAAVEPATPTITPPHDSDIAPDPFAPADRAHR